MNELLQGLINYETANLWRNLRREEIEERAHNDVFVFDYSQWVSRAYGENRVIFQYKEGQVGSIQLVTTIFSNQSICNSLEWILSKEAQAIGTVERYAIDWWPGDQRLVMNAFYDKDNLVSPSKPYFLQIQLDPHGADIIYRTYEPGYVVGRPIIDVDHGVAQMPRNQLMQAFGFSFQDVLRPAGQREDPIDLSMAFAKLVYSVCKYGFFTYPFAP